MYKFYYNVDTGEIAQLYLKDDAVGTGEEWIRAFHKELERVTGKWSDCYMPVYLTYDLFGKYQYILDAQIKDEVMSAFHFENQVMNHSYVYESEEEMGAEETRPYFVDRKN